MFDRHKDDEIEPLHGASYTRQPGVDVESLGLIMGDQVRKNIGGATIENPILPLLGQRLHRSLQLKLEIFEGRHLREFVPFLQEKVVGLSDRCVGWKGAKQLFDERSLPGPVRPRDCDSQLGMTTLTSRPGTMMTWATFFPFA